MATYQRMTYRRWCFILSLLVGAAVSYIFVTLVGLHHITKDFWHVIEKSGKAGIELNKNKTWKENVSVQTQTSDHWPVFSKPYYPFDIPPSPFHPTFTIRWDFNTSELLERSDVKGHPPKIILWMVKTRYLPELPEPVRLRVCPEMPCRMTTNKQYKKESAALVWFSQIMMDPVPPVRSNPDQVFVFHDDEPQTRDWINIRSFRKPAWKSSFNWTMHYRFDSDIVSPYGKIVKRQKPVTKNYTDILAKKTKFAAWLSGHCPTSSKREEYVKLLQKYIAVDVFGFCGPQKRESCPRNRDDVCLKMISKDYKFFLGFESSFCRDYVTEKFFRYLEADTVVVARGSNDYKYQAPNGIFINTADFNSAREVAEYLLYLDSHPNEYIQLLKAKDQYQALFEDYPIRTKNGKIGYMEYHYEAEPFCEMCRRLWNLDSYRKTIPDIGKWFDKGNCYDPKDLK